MDTPVLVVAFNRPERLASLIDHLRTQGPADLYVAVDGPRADRENEQDLVIRTRDEVSRVDWPCNVRTLFRDQNLGCGRSVSGALDWFFGQEEKGIVLEDDVLPRPTFYPFAEELLARFGNDERVWAISGTNFVPPSVHDSWSSYRFSTVPHIWGWASWSRSWATYRYQLRRWRKTVPARRLWRVMQHSPSAFAYWSGMFDLMARGSVDTWDFQFVHAAFARDALTAVSNTNLVDNLGFGVASTHTAAAPHYIVPSSELDFPLRHPASVTPDLLADRWTQRHVFEATPAGLARQAGRFLRERVRTP